MATLNRIVSDGNYLDSERKMINGENLQIFQFEQIANGETLNLQISQIEQIVRTMKIMWLVGET